jgi:GTP-binding protein Era
MQPPNEPPSLDPDYRRALASVTKTLDRFRGCRDSEKEQLRTDFSQLQRMHAKLVSGRVDIVVFGEISTGKSALINALVGEAVAEVDVKGGWTKEVWRVPWDGCGYCVPGLGQSQVVLVDTPGLNEVGGAERAGSAAEAARQADLILFVSDSDLNETEFAALVSLAAVNKPIVFVLNKIDLYSPEQRQRLLDVLMGERLADIISSDNLVATSSDPREVEYVIESPDGSTRNEWRKPEPNVADLKDRILALLEEDGLALLALNAALYAADKSDRVASLRVEMRNRAATKVIWGYAVAKAVGVAANPVPVVDTAGGTAVDATMVGHLGYIYGIELSWAHSRELVKGILKAAGWMMGAELSTHLVSWVVKAGTLGWGAALTAVPQAAAAGYGSYIVGQAAQYYFEHGASWGGENPKSVVARILEETDRKSVISNLKSEIRQKLLSNKYAEK